MSHMDNPDNFAFKGEIGWTVIQQENGEYEVQVWFQVSESHKFHAITAVEIGRAHV